MISRGMRKKELSVAGTMTFPSEMEGREDPSPSCSSSSDASDSTLLTRRLFLALARFGVSFVPTIDNMIQVSAIDAHTTGVEEVPKERDAYFVRARSFCERRRAATSSVSVGRCAKWTRWRLTGVG